MAKGEIALKETSESIANQRTNNRRAEIRVKYKLNIKQVIIEESTPDLIDVDIILPELDTEDRGVDISFENLKEGDKIVLENILFFRSLQYPEEVYLDCWLRLLTLHVRTQLPGHFAGKWARG